MSTVFSQEDELVGQIIQASNQQIMSKEVLIEKMLESDVVYLGEKHDNANHHEIQIDIINSLIEKGIKPIIGFEFFYQHQTSELIKFVKGIKSPFHHGEENPEKEENKLRNKLGWQNRSDEDWKFYFNFLKQAKKQKLDVFGADIPSGLISRISRGGLESLTPIELKQLSPTNFHDPIYQKLMVEKFKDSHCGWVPEDNFEKLYQTWVARNDAMANSISAMLVSKGENLVIMIVGGGHVEHNMGIFERVSHLNPNIKQLNLGLTEIAIESTPLIDRIEKPVIGNLNFESGHEYYWFTPRADYDDPCKGF